MSNHGKTSCQRLMGRHAADLRDRWIILYEFLLLRELRIIAYNYVYVYASVKEACHKQHRWRYVHQCN